MQGGRRSQPVRFSKLVAGSGVGRPAARGRQEGRGSTDAILSSKSPATEKQLPTRTRTRTRTRQPPEQYVAAVSRSIGRRVSAPCAVAPPAVLDARASHAPSSTTLPQNLRFCLNRALMAGLAPTAAALLSVRPAHHVYTWLLFRRPV